MKTTVGVITVAIVLDTTGVARKCPLTIWFVVTNDVLIDANVSDKLTRVFDSGVDLCRGQDKLKCHASM